MPLTFTISVKPGLRGKQGELWGVWQTRTMTPTQLAQWSFFEHQAYCHSVFDANEYQRNPQHYKMSKANAFFLYSEVVTVDVDSKDLTDEEKSRSNLDWFLSQEFIRRHCFLITPSSGNSPEKPNWHLSFKLDKPVTDVLEYRRVALALHSLIGLPTDHQTAKAAQPTYGTLFKDEARHAAGYHASDIYVNDEAEVVSVDWLGTIKPVEGSHLHKLIEAQNSKVQAQNYAQTEHAQRRVALHREQPIEAREKVVLECLSYILPTFNEETPYELWFQVWSAAHDGAPTERVRDYIVNHPNVFWSDGAEGKAKFIHAFNTHVHAEGGYTVASLFYLARKAGWLSKTGYEIPESLAEKIDVDFIPDWMEGLEEVPTRLLLQSQTGSGKTQNLIRLWRRLGEPKTVVFVPSIKLATELATTLRKAGLPAVLYMDIRTNRIASPKTLANARVLVTTLQSFATKVHRGHPIMHGYGLVYIEESDQLLSQFARGGGGIYGSHVREHEAQLGFAVLRDALQNAPHVWMVDATMSQVSYLVATSMSSEPVRYVLNVRIKPKAAVHMIEEKGQALQAVLQGLLEDKRVVVAADTKDQAREVIETMTQLGVLEGKKAILITKETEHHPAVQDFMSDVESEATKYDLVAYNSVMASGVSITSIKPDVIVQFSGYLTPRANLQILNRYRKQEKVYCYYTVGENFYQHTAEDVYGEAERRVDLESRVVNVPLLERTEDAKVRARAGSVSIGDELLQRRAAREFYMELLRRDGRKVYSTQTEPPSEQLKHTLKGVREARKEMREYIAHHWNDPDIEPVDQDRPARAGMTDLQVACGIRKAEIERLLKGYIPEDATPEEIDSICSEFEGHVFLLSAFARQEIAIKRAEEYLTDRGKAILAVANNATMIALVTLTRLMYQRLDDQLTPELVTERAPLFMSELTKWRDQYDAITSRQRDKFAVVIEDNPTVEEQAVAFTKKLLARIGLRQRADRLDRKGGKERRVYFIENFDRVNKFLSWRYHKVDENGDPVEAVLIDPQWRFSTFETEVEKRKRAVALMVKLPPEQQAVVYERLAEPNTTFEMAVLSVVDGGLL